MCDCFDSHPQLPHIPCLERLQSVFPRDTCTSINWASEKSTFSLFVQLLDEPQYRSRVMLGIIYSAGGIAANLVIIGVFVMVKKLPISLQWHLNHWYVFMTDLTSFCFNSKECNWTVVLTSDNIDFGICEPWVIVLMGDNSIILYLFLYRFGTLVRPYKDTSMRGQKTKSSSRVSGWQCWSCLPATRKWTASLCRSSEPLASYLVHQQSLIQSVEKPSLSVLPVKKSVH